MFRITPQENTQYSFLIERCQKKPRSSILTLTDPEIIKIKEASFGQRRRTSLIKSSSEREALYLETEVIDPPIFEGYHQAMHLTIDRWHEPRPRFRTDFGQTHITFICTKETHEIQIRLYCDIYGQIKDYTAKDNVTTEPLFLSTHEKNQAHLHAKVFTSFLTSLLQYKTEVYFKLAQSAQQLDDELMLIFNMKTHHALEKIEKYISIVQTMHLYQPEQQTHLLLNRLRDRRAELSASPSSIRSTESFSPPPPPQLKESPKEASGASSPKKTHSKKKKQQTTEEAAMITALQQDITIHIDELLIQLRILGHEHLNTTAYQHLYHAQKGLTLIELLEMDTHGEEKHALVSFKSRQYPRIPAELNLNLIQYFKEALLKGEINTIRMLHPVIAHQLHDEMESLVVDFLIAFITSQSTQERMAEVCEFMLEHSGTFKIGFIRAMRIYISTRGFDSSLLFKMLVCDHFRAFSIAIQYSNLSFPIISFERLNFSALQIAIYFYTEEKADSRFIEALLEEGVPLEFNLMNHSPHLTKINPDKIYRDQGKNIAAKYAKKSASNYKPILTTEATQHIPILKEHFELISSCQNALEFAIIFKKPSLIPTLCRHLKQRELLDFFGKFLFNSVFTDRLSPFGIKIVGENFYKDIQTLEDAVCETPQAVNHPAILFYISERLPEEDVDYYLNIGRQVYQIFIEFHAHFSDEVRRRDMYKLRRSGESSERPFDLPISQLYCLFIREKTLEDHEFLMETYYHRSFREAPLSGIQALFYLSSLPQSMREQIRTRPLYTNITTSLLENTADIELFNSCVMRLREMIEEGEANVSPSISPSSP